jgi:transposase IS66 family protein
MLLRAVLSRAKEWGMLPPAVQMSRLPKLGWQIGYVLSRLSLRGASVSWATVERAICLFSAKLVRCEQRIKSAIHDSSVIGADEIELRVAGSNGWIHVAKTDRLTHFGYDWHRGKAAMDEIGILPQFKGMLVRDGYLSYT